MANRVLRDWTDSDRINGLDFQAEVLFTRLMMKADDYGSFHANPKLINAFCFPLKNIRETDITRWLQQLVSAGLIALYNAENKRYLHIINFGQRLRQMKSKFPQISENELNNFMAANGQRVVSGLSAGCPPETETETETETENPQTPKGGSHDKIDFKKLLEFINKKTGRKFIKIDEATKRKFNARLNEGYTKQDILNAISNAVNDDFHKESGFKWLTPEYFSRAKSIEKNSPKSEIKTSKPITNNEGFAGPWAV